MIEITINNWLGSLNTPLYPLAIPDDKNAPAVVYRIESEFTPDDGNAPYGAQGHRVRLSIWHPSYKSASTIATQVRQILRATHQGFLVTVEDRGDYQDADTNLYGIVLDVEITTLQQVSEAPQQGLRAAIKNQLLDSTTALTAVYATRIGFANSDQFPMVGISMQSEDIETDNADQKRRIELVINAKTNSSIDSENQLELLVSEIESRLHPDKNFGDARIDIARISTNYSAIGRLHFEHRILTFNVEYFAPIPDIEDVAQYEKSGVHWDIDQDSTSEAEDFLSFPN